LSRSNKSRGERATFAAEILDKQLAVSGLTVAQLAMLYGTSPLPSASTAPVEQADVGSKRSPSVCGEVHPPNLLRRRMRSVRTRFGTP
jgi:hypothetical protein